jgi:hypothetical protein
MPLSVVDLYRDVLPKTNCRKCGFQTCIAFASMVISEKLPLEKCPYLSPKTLADCNAELQVQYADGKWTKRDLAQDALKWAKQRSASMNIRDLPERIGGRLVERDGRPVIELPYFNRTIFISSEAIADQSGSPLTRWEQVFIFNHMAQGGSSQPTGKWTRTGGIPQYDFQNQIHAEPRRKAT